MASSIVVLLLCFLCIAVHGAASSRFLLSDPASASGSSSIKKSSTERAFRPYWNMRQEHEQQHEQLLFGGSKAFEGSSEFVKMRYHMGPVLTPEMHIYIVWYGNWKRSDKSVIRDFINSISPSRASTSAAGAAAPVAVPSVQQWWSTVRLYTDQTQHNVTESVEIAGEHDVAYSHGHSLTRLTVQEVLKGALLENNGTLPANSHKGIYLILTAGDVLVQDFCRAVCGFHYFSFPSIVGYTLPYAWIGHSERQCPDVCAYPFVLPSYMRNSEAMKSPNGNPAIDGMLSVIGHELAEISSNPLINAWYAGEDPTAPTEIADLCEGTYGTGGGGGYPGAVFTDAKSSVNFNMHGIHGRKFLIQWIWNPILKACSGPNAQD